MWHRLVCPLPQQTSPGLIQEMSPGDFGTGILKSFDFFVFYTDVRVKAEVFATTLDYYYSYIAA
jgi:hypothetical protein